MGRVMLRMAAAQPEVFTVIAGVDAFGGEEAEGFPVYCSLTEAPQDADVVIDFSRPDAIPALIDYCVKNNARLVACTTGLSEQHSKQLDNAAEKIPVFQSGNMSLGVNLQIELLKTTASTLGDAFDVEITEKHHNRKVDAPSGTALMLADAIRAQYPAGMEYIYGRHSKDARRTPTEIGIHAVRGGTVVGEHEVAFYGQDEVITIQHQAYSKQVFGTGALRAAQYIMQKQPGRYNMQNIVTEHSVLSHLYADAEQSLITLSCLPNEPGVMQNIFGAIARQEVFVDMISMTSPDGTSSSVSFSLPRGQLAVAINALKSLAARYSGLDVYALDHLTKITVEGPGMALRHGVAGELFAVLAEAGVCIELVTTSETKISFCVKDGDVNAALQALKEKFTL